MISDFRREVDENCTLQSYYAASSGNFLPTFRDNLSVPYSWVKNPKLVQTVEDGTGRLPRNVGKELPPLTAYYPEERGSVSAQTVTWFVLAQTLVSLSQVQKVQLLRIKVNSF